MNLHQQLSSYPTQGTINTDFIIQCLDNFCQTLAKTTVVVWDNAPWHIAQAFQDSREDWEYNGLFVFYLLRYITK